MSAPGPNKHVSVLLEECISHLSPNAKDDAPIFVDCTLGGAGHTQALLERYPNAKVLACDLDENAIAAAKKRLSAYCEQKRLAFFHGNFAEVVQSHSISKIENDFRPPWSGVLLDLGYSSNQLESEDYGMSFQLEAPLDMRLSRPPVGASAWELLNQASEQELGEILATYGEMQGAFALGRALKKAVRDGEVEDSTGSLSRFLEVKNPRKKYSDIHPATLVFQALRIAVNDELRNLDRFLNHVILNLKAQGRVLVITFHSLEDRIVKNWGAKNRHQLNFVTRKPIIASENEISENPRARSAKLRGFEKL